MKLLLFLLVFLQAYLVFSNRIDKAFESLNRKDYYTAHKLFQKSIKKQESISAFGLTQLYLRHDYQNLDSAYRYILISESSFGSLNTKDRLKFSKFQFDSLAIQSWKQLVSDELFEEILNTPTEISLQKFIDQNSWSNQLGKAILLRDSISFFEMKALNTSQLTYNFLAKYPNSIYSKPANSLLQDQQFEESTRSGMLSDYEKFVKEYPENKHYVDAENRIYELATKLADINAYKQFISTYPKNRNINDAWRQLYQLYMMDFDPAKFDSFEKEFTDYPFIEELKTDRSIYLESYFPVAYNEKYGYINASGKIVIPAEYDEVGPFKDGLAVVSKYSKYGVINKKNELVVDFGFDEILDFNNARAIVIKNDLYNLIDRSGRIISTRDFADLFVFSSNIYAGMLDSHYVFYDQNLIEFSAVEFQEVGLLSKGFAIVKQNNLFGLIDSSLNIKIKCQFDDLVKFNEGQFIYTLNSKKGLISAEGVKLTEPIYDEISAFNSENNTAIVKIGSQLNWIKKDGSKLFDLSMEYFPNSLELAQFSKGYAIYRKKGKFGLIDDKAKLAFKTSLDQIGKYVNFIPTIKDGKWGLIDLKGKIVTPYEFELIEDWNNRGILIQKNGLTGMLNYQLGLVLPIEFNSIKVFEEQFLIVIKGSKCGLYDFSGKEVLPIIYDRIQLFEKDCLTLFNENEVLYYFIRTKRFLKRTE
jgi:hypothetical protein